jgi:hypothetical protein
VALVVQAAGGGIAASAIEVNVENTVYDPPLTKLHMTLTFYFMVL